MVELRTSVMTGLKLNIYLLAGIKVATCNLLYSYMYFKCINICETVGALGCVSAGAYRQVCLGTGDCRW